MPQAWPGTTQVGHSERMISAKDDLDALFTIRATGRLDFCP